MSELAPQHRKAYLLSGDAIATIVSRRTGQRFTYRVKQPNPDLRLAAAAGTVPPHFVSVLTGPENTSNYAFLGTIFSDGTYRHGRKSRIAPDSPSAVAFAWSWAHLEGPRADEIQVYHLGSCGRCGRPLTTPESIERGLGPVCAGRA